MIETNHLTLSEDPEGKKECKQLFLDSQREECCSNIVVVVDTVAIGTAVVVGTVVVGIVVVGPVQLQ